MLDFNTDKSEKFFKSIANLAKDISGVPPHIISFCITLVALGVFSWRNVMTIEKILGKSDKH